MIRYLFLLMILPISILPFAVLHRFSELLCFFVYRLLGYRKKVVRENLRIAFPDKPDAELDRIESGFYLHLCDLIFESIKTFTISREDLQKRMRFTTPETTQSLAAAGVHVSGIGSHYNNWEWIALGIAMDVKQIAYGVYKPLSHPAWNDLFLRSRTRFGIRMIPIKAVREVLDAPHERPILMGLLADQAPHDYEKAFEVEFLGQKTYVTPGPAVITVQRGYAPVWGSATKVGRSRYEWGIVPIDLDASAITAARGDTAQVERIARVHQLTPDQAAYAIALTREFTLRLEKQIKMAPQFWLWSHRRWKSR